MSDGFFDTLQDMEGYYREAIAQRDEALDALEMMVTQYLYAVPDQSGRFDHMFMACEEEACEVLVSLRPDRWQATKTGVVMKRSDP